MSYANPDILILTNPRGIDAIVQSIQQSLYAGVPWLTKSFGRAWEFKEFDENGSPIRVPKAYIGNGEYHNVLPNDNLTAQSFIAVRGQERWGDEFSAYNTNNLERDISVIFWFNLKQINPAKDYIFTEELKNDVEKVLKTIPYIKTFVDYWDERAEDVFDAYDLRTVRYGVNDTTTQYLMHPYAGFRFTLTVAYPEYATCTPFGQFNIVSPVPQVFDIEFKATGGEASFTDPRLVGRKVRVTRMGITQYEIGSGSYWAFDSSTGTVFFSPALDVDEEVSIQVYGFN